MKRITALILAVAAAVLTMVVVAGSASAQTTTEQAGAAGTVTFSTEGGTLSFVEADPAAGWDFSVVRQDGTHLKVVFTSVDGLETEFEAELEDGRVVVEASEPTSAGATTSTTIVGFDNSVTTTTSADVATTSTTLNGAATTSTTLDDDDDDDGDDRVRDRFDEFVGDVTLVVGPAGTVSIHGDGEEIALLGVDVSSGWDFVIDRSDDGHIEIRFFGSAGVEIEFEAQFMGDHLDWKYEFESDDDDETTSTTAPDDDDDDDDDDDNSGHGSDDDDDDDDDGDDNSGHGSDDD